MLYRPIIAKVCLALTALLPDATGASAKPPSAQVLIHAYGQADEACRGSAGDSGAAECDRRSRLSSRLNQIGWCNGKRGQSRADFEWHHCTPASLETSDLAPSP